MTSLPVVAAFDFDGTLTKRDSLFPFLLMVAGPRRFGQGLVSLSPVLGGYGLGLLPNHRAKERVLTHFLQNLTEEQLGRIAQRFAVEAIPSLLRPKAMQQLQWHRSQGHRVLLVSASPELYLKPWAEPLGLEVLGTRLEVVAGRYTGQIVGNNCHGPEKVNRLSACLGDLKDYCLWAYGDSSGDKELLQAADYPNYRSF